MNKKKLQLINKHHIIRIGSWWYLALAWRQAIFALNKVATPALELTWSIAAAWSRPEKNAQETRISQQQSPKWSNVVQYNNPGEKP